MRSRVPGMPNVHSHAFQRAMAGLTEIAGPGEDSFWTWRELMYRFLERLGPDDIEAISAFAFMEMLETGFTRVGEFHYLHHDPKGVPYADVAELTHRIVAAAQRSGIGLTLLPVLYAHANFGGLPPNAGQRRFINDVEGFARLLEAARKAVKRLDDGCRRHCASQPPCGDAAGIAGGNRPRAARTHPYSCGRADPGGGRLPGVVGPAAGGMAAGQCADRCALVLHPRDASDCR